MLDEQKAEAQQALDELFSEHLLPFKLSAHMVTSSGAKDYMVHFYDSRLHSVEVLWHQDESFKNLLRAAVLERVNGTRSPLRWETAA